MYWWKHCITAFAVASVLHSFPASAQQNFDFRAFVIANSGYTGLTELSPSIEDGRKVKTLLEDKLKYKVAPHAHFDVKTKDEFLGKWREFLKSITGNTIALFYFSGHGAEANNDSFLLPISVPAEPQEVHVLSQGVNLRRLFKDLRDRQKELGSGVQVHGVFIIDACRSELKKDNETKDVSGGKAGAKPIMPPPGIFVLYAASAGQVAHAKLNKDEKDKPSVYTRHLLDLLSESSRPVSLQTIARWVRWKVHSDVAAHKPAQPQTPAYYDELPPLQLESRVLTLEGLAEEDKEGQARLEQLQKEPMKQRPEEGRAVWECEDCPHLVVVPAAPELFDRVFMMGSPADDPDRKADEESEAASGDDRRLKVTIPESFAIGIAEVTVAQYRAFLVTRPDNKGACPVMHPACVEKNGDKPVVGVSWRDTQEYIGWLNAKLDLDRKSKPERGYYRLPTESEWEFSARGGVAGRFLVEEESQLCEYGNGADQELHALTLANTACSDRKGRGVSQVKSYKPNNFGLYDVHGNVWEWVADCWSDKLTADKTDPTKDLMHGNLMDKTCRRVARGGSWLSAPVALRLSKRIAFAPDHVRPTLGFRVMRVLPNR